MKKHLLLPIILCLLTYSCKKDQQADIQTSSDDKTYELNFRAKTVSATANGTSSTAAADSSAAVPSSLKYISYLCYGLEEPTYNKKSLIAYVVKDSSDADIAGLNLNLPKGKYRIFAVASNKPVEMDLASDYSAYPPIVMYKDNQTDLFVARTDITVDGKAIEKELLLQRKVGQIRIVISDPVPADARRIDVVLFNELNKYSLDPLYPNFDTWYKTVTLSRVIKPEDIGKTDLEFIFYALNGPAVRADYKSPLDITIRAFYNTEGKTSEKSIPQVDNRANIKTTLTGTLFGDKEDMSAFTITYDPLFSGHNEWEF